MTSPRGLPVKPNVPSGVRVVLNQTAACAIIAIALTYRRTRRRIKKMPTEPGLKSRLRDELISRAKLGEITPEDAESEAMLVDCGPLELRPESLDLDPGKENEWTLIMALVWIIERDPTAVHAVWIKARRAATHWVGSPLAESDGTGAAKKKSWELKPLDPPTVGDVDAVVDEEAGFMLPPFIVPGHAAREDLWANLRSGRLPAQGKRRGTSERIDILMSDWTDLDWLADLTASADTVGDRMENAPKYDDVSVSGQRVREIWPPLEDVQSEEYHREDWSVEHAVLWIAYRNPALFHFVGLNGPRARAQFSSAERRDSAPKRTLLNALMTDKLRAFQNGQELPPAFWFGRGLPRRQPEATRIYFQRSAVMGISNDKPLVEANSKKHPGGAPPILDWHAVESALEAECKLQESVPHRKHSDRHWRTKADAYRWVREEYLKQRKGGGPSDTAMKTRVGPMLDRINERLQKVGN